MKRLLFLGIMIFSLNLVYSQRKADGMIPVTSTSIKAIQYVDLVRAAMIDGRIQHIDLYSNKALEEDPNMFFILDILALQGKWRGNNKNFKLYGESAVKNQTNLSEPEELLKGATIRILEDASVDVTEVGKRIVESYPDDIFSHMILLMLQVSCGDDIGAVLTLQNAINYLPQPAFIYNLLGYQYMNMDKLDSAETAFNKYLELAPYKPNAYDSKGNYYRRIGEYQKAYDTYMTGYDLDTTFKIIYNHAITLKKNRLDTLNIKN